MRSLTLFCLATRLLAIFVNSAVAADLSTIQEAQTAYGTAIIKAQADYRKVFAGELADATKVEVFLLDFDAKKYPASIEYPNWEFRLKNESFPILPDKRATRILKRKELTSSQTVTLIAALQDTIGARKEKKASMCHFPIHGIRVWADDQILFQTSLCWSCGTFYMKYPDGTADWVSIESPDLQRLMNDYMPIPAEEQKRFKKSEHLLINLRGE